MKKSIKHIGLLLCIITVIGIGACKKVNNSIVGTWHYSQYQAGDFPSDTAIFNYPPMSMPYSSSINFTSDGHYTFYTSHITLNFFTEIDTSHNISGTYLVNSDTLTLYDPSYPTTPSINKIIRVDDHSLTVLQIDSLVFEPTCCFQILSFYTR